MTTSLSESSRDTGPSHTGPSGHNLGLGERLRRARNDRGLTLEQIANETRIPQRNLEAFEHDNFAVVPAGFYRRAQIRAYARAVNLDQSLASSELDRAEAAPEAPKGQGPILSRQRVWIVIGVVVAAAVFWRAGVGREPAVDSGGHVRSVIDSPQQEVPLFERRRPTSRSRHLGSSQLRRAILPRQRDRLKSGYPRTRSPNSS